MHACASILCLLYVGYEPWHSSEPTAPFRLPIYYPGGYLGTREARSPPGRGAALELTANGPIYIAYSTRDGMQPRPAAAPRRADSQQPRPWLYCEEGLSEEKGPRPAWNRQPTTPTKSGPLLSATPTFRYPPLCLTAFYTTTFNAQYLNEFYINPSQNFPSVCLHYTTYIY